MAAISEDVATALALIETHGARNVDAVNLSVLIGELQLIERRRIAYHVGEVPRHRKIERTARYLGVDMEDALTLRTAAMSGTAHRHRVMDAMLVYVATDLRTRQVQYESW